MLRRGGGEDSTSSGSSRTLPQSDARFCDEFPASGGRRRRRSGPTTHSSSSSSSTTTTTTKENGCSVTRSNGTEESVWTNQPKLRGLLKLIAGQIETSATSSATMMQRDHNNNNNNNNNNSGSGSGSLVSVYRYHGETLRRSQVELQAKPRSRRRRRRLQHKEQLEQLEQHKEQHKEQSEQHEKQSSSLALPTDEECGSSTAAAASISATSSVPSYLEHSSTDLPFATVVARKRFVAFFVVQGHERAAASSKKDFSSSCHDHHHCYSAHTLALRQRLARDYHDVMSTFVLDLTVKVPPALGGDAWGEERDDDEYDDEYDDDDDEYDVEQNRHSTFHRGNSSSSSGTAGFCFGTGFAVLPTTPHNVPTLLMLLGGIRKVPAVVVVDTRNGRALPRDAFLAVQTNDPHLVIQRWQQAHKRDCCWCPSGLTSCQTLGRALLCESEDYSCCVVQ